MHLSARWHSYPIVSVPYPMYDCWVDSMEHPVVRPTASQCLQAVLWALLWVSLCACRLQEGEGVTGAGPFLPSDQRRAKWCVFCSYSLVLLERLLQMLATDHLISIARTTFLSSQQWRRTRSVRKALFCLCKRNFSVLLADSWVSDWVKMINYKDSAWRLVLTRNCRDHP